MFDRISRRVEPLAAKQFLNEEQQAYFRAHGAFPPILSPNATYEQIEAQIQGTRAVAEATHDTDRIEQLANEIGYLANVLERKK